MAKITSLAELTDVASDDLLVVVDKSDTSMADSGTNKKVKKSNLLKEYAPLDALLTGWIPAGETWTYASADDPTFTFTISGDKTSKYSAGMRIKLTQTTVKYFIITAVSYSSPNTTITVYGGTDYDLANATITNPYYSTQKAPQGFPLNPAKWTITTTYTSLWVKHNPVNKVWYNVGMISIPIGSWNINYIADVFADENAGVGRIDIYATLSTSNNSQSTAEHTIRMTTSSVSLQGAVLQYTGSLVLTSKTAYYLNIKLDNTTSPLDLGCDGSQIPLRIKATCAYL